MKNEVIEIIPEFNEDDLIIRLGFTLKVDDEETGETLSSVLSVEFSVGVEALTDDDKKTLILQSVQYNSALTDLESRLLLKRTARVISTEPERVVLTDAESRAMWVSLIDLNIGNIIKKRTQFQMGYEKREAAANTYKDDGYTGDPTIWISAFADSAGKTYQEACDIILMQAYMLRTALEDLEALRMGKYRVLRAASKEEAQAIFIEILTDAANIDEALG